MALGETPREPMEIPHFVSRLRVLIWVGVAMLLVFLVRLVDITLIHGSENAAAADSFLYRPALIDAPRGLIRDRNGVLLASNRLRYEVSLSRVGLSRAELEVTLDGLIPFFPEIVEEWRARMEERRRLPRLPQVLTTRPLTLEDATPLFEQIAGLPGVRIDEQFERHYPVRGASLGHVLGYVAEVNPRNLRTLLRSWDMDTSDIDWDEMSNLNTFANALRMQGYELGDAVGVQGLELTHERDLRGVKGVERILQDAHSRVLDWTTQQVAEPGHTLRLTLDLEMQRLAMDLLAGGPGTIIALDPRDGGVLVLASSPGFDSDQPMTLRGWSDLVTDSAGRPLVNRTIREVYNPGSTIKPMVAMGALRDGAIDEDTTFYCDGSYELGGHIFRCDYQWGCEWQEVRQAIRRSCNVFFYNTMHSAGGVRLGQAGWERMCLEFGLFQPTGIDLPGESTGHIPSRTLYAGEVIQLGIGQGPFDVTPLQMVTAYARLAMNRADIVPHLVDRIEDTKGDLISVWQPPDGLRSGPVVEGLSEEHRQLVLEAMSEVVSHERGTAHRVGFPEEWRAAGKTGTAQNRGQIDAWFIGFAPWDDPEIVVGCVVEGGGHGADAAAPIVRDIMEAHFARAEMSEAHAVQDMAVGGGAASAEPSSDSTSD